jgi:hypothetical protein
MLRAKMILVGRVVAKSCSIGFGNPSADNPGFQLGVPFYRQEGPVNCAPAAIQMWAAYDGNFVSQTDIANYVGCTSAGTVPANAVRGVAFFTATKDPFLDYNPGEDARYFSRQITSINVSRPVMASLAGAHVGVINGGAWHQTSSGLNVWDFVLFHDPGVGANQEYAAGDWLNLNDSQVIGRSAAAGADTYLGQYGQSVAVRGSDYRVPPTM